MTELAAVSLRTTKHLIDLGFVFGAVGGVAIASSSLAWRGTATGRWLLRVAGALLTAAFALAGIAIEFGHL